MYVQTVPQLSVIQIAVPDHDDCDSITPVQEVAPNTQ